MSEERSLKEAVKTVQSSFYMRKYANRKSINRKTKNDKKKKRRKIKEQSSSNDNIMEEDELISYYGKKLGVTDNLIPHSFKDDGLDYLLDVCDDTNVTNEEEIGEDIPAKNKKKRKKRKIESSCQDATDTTKKENDVKGVKEENIEAKYVPPALKKQFADPQLNEDPKYKKIKQTMKGLLNRLTEATLPGIFNNMKAMYEQESKNVMNKLLSTLLIEACVPQARIVEKFVAEHMLLVASFHFNETGFSMHFLRTLLAMFTDVHEANKFPESKNILLMLSILHCLKVVDSEVIFDLLKQLLDSLNEDNVELILVALKVCGPALRKDHPVALKEFILQVQQAASNHEETPRLQFLLDSIIELKNNKSQQILCLGEGTTKRIIKEHTCPPLRLNERKVAAPDTQETHYNEVENKLKKAATKQRMNTELRKNIFYVIMSSEDYVNAFERLIKLNLKTKQAREIVHVIVDCCLQGKAYNPYFAYLLGKLCAYTHNDKVTLQYCVWDRLKTVERLAKHNTSNLLHLIAHLLSTETLSLAVLKVVCFADLSNADHAFHRQLFRRLLQKPDVTTIFQKIAHDKKLGILRDGLKVYLQRLAREGEVQRNTVNALVEVLDGSI